MAVAYLNKVLVCIVSILQRQHMPFIVSRGTYYLVFNQVRLIFLDGIVKELYSRLCGGKCRIGNFRLKLGSLPKNYKARFNRPPPTQTKSCKHILEPKAT